jgi:hypothetical protein
MSRRTFIGGAITAAGSAAAAPLLLPTSALATKSSSAPKPIPGGFVIGGQQFHVNLPGMGVENSSITDFTGKIGFADVQGEGTGRNRKTGERMRLLYDTDMRFMKGAYIGQDGHRHRGTFAFV